MCVAPEPGLLPWNCVILVQLSVLPGSAAGTVPGAAAGLVPPRCGRCR